MFLNAVTSKGFASLREHLPVVCGSCFTREEKPVFLGRSNQSCKNKMLSQARDLQAIACFVSVREVKSLEN